MTEPVSGKPQTNQQHVLVVKGKCFCESKHIDWLGTFNLGKSDSIRRYIFF